MGLSMGHLLIVLVIVLVLFGAGKLPRMMGDMGRGIRSFKDGLNGRDDADQKRLPDRDPNDREPPKA